MSLKKYEELDFTNDFMFCKILKENKELCRELVELILERKVKKIVYIQKQDAIEITSDGKGIRLDVYFEDEESTVYDLEMQTTMDKHLPKRSRYYQGMIDLNLIQRGDSYKKLKKSYIIFICLTNPFDGQLHKYTFENRCRENPELILGDETVKVVVTPQGIKQDVTEEMQQFLCFLAGQKADSDFTKKIEAEVTRARKKEDWRLEYMTLQMRDQENIEKGIQQGIEKGKIEVAVKMMRKGSSDEEIMEMTDLSREQVLELRRESV